MVPPDDAGWKPTTWWQITYGGTVWCETSDRDEAIAKLATCPGKPVVRRLYQYTEYDWREVLTP